MNCKKVIAILLISTCISHALHGMEIVKDIVRNEVVPAAAIIGTGAALGVVSNIIYNTVHHFANPTIFNFYHKPTLKKSIITGIALSLPIVVRARFDCNDRYPQPNPSKFALLAGAPFLTIFGFCVMANYDNVRDISSYGDDYTTQMTCDVGFLKRQLQAIQCITAASLFMGYPWLIRSS